MLLLAVVLAAVASAPPDLSAIGLVLTTPPERSVAILRSQGQNRVVQVGENAFGGRVVGIAADGISVEFGADRVLVRLRRGDARLPLAAARPALQEDPATPGRTMMRAEVQRRIAEETPKILSETAIAPVSGDDGRVAGFAITRLPTGTNVLADAGLRPGDVVTQINGTPIDGLPTLISLWPRLQNEKEIRAVVLRDGKPVTISVSLR